MDRWKSAQGGTGVFVVSIAPLTLLTESPLRSFFVGNLPIIASDDYASFILEGSFLSISGRELLADHRPWLAKRGVVWIVQLPPSLLILITTPWTTYKS